MTPTVYCLCPTFRAKPAKLIGNSIACFESQDYPKDKRFLFIYDDTGYFEPVSGDNWSLVVDHRREPNLSAKYNKMLSRVSSRDIVLVWDDDDIYLPWHITSHVKSLQTSQWSHPEYCYSLYTGKLELEGTRGLFHGSLGAWRNSIKRVGDWPDTLRADFDQKMIRKLANQFGNPGRPEPPSYVFRWGSTKAPHTQGFMKSPDDETWYDQCGKLKAGDSRRVTPAFDEETETLIRRMA